MVCTSRRPLTRISYTTLVGSSGDIARRHSAKPRSWADPIAAHASMSSFSRSRSSIFHLERPRLMLLPLRNGKPVIYKTHDQLILKLRNPGPLFWRELRAGRPRRSKAGGVFSPSAESTANLDLDQCGVGRLNGASDAERICEGKWLSERGTAFANSRQFRPVRDLCTAGGCNPSLPKPPDQQ
jgi:hypothetical protein